jgi:hypothetical protein
MESITLAVGFFCFICRVFVTVAPADLTEKIPDNLMLFISACALVSNKICDNKGNRISKDGDEK